MDMNTPVNFKLAKLLKEKGFDKQTYWYLTHKRKFPTSEDAYYPEQTSKPQNWNDDGNLKFYERFSAPTIADVVMWLYEKYGIWIEVRKFKNKPNIANTILKKKGFEYVIKNVTVEIPYNTPTKAYEAGIEYALENLIK